MINSKEGMDSSSHSETYIKTQGNQAYHRRDYPSALKWYTLGINTYPSSSLFYLNRSMVYLSQHKYHDSIIDSSKALSLDPSNPKTSYRKAVALKALGDHKEALNTLKNFLDSYPENEEISKLYQEIIEKSQQFNLEPSHPERQKFEDLFEWLVKGGSIFPKIYLEYYSHDYRGVHCAREIDKGEVVLLIPNSHIITLEMAKAEPVGRKMIEHNLDLLSPKHCFLTTFILQEQRKPDSFWKPYLNILPQSYSNFPIFFSDDDLEILAGSPFLDQINEKRADIMEDYRSICSADPTFKQYTIEEFSKTRMAVSSRIFSIEVKGKDTDAFVPLADMLNHRRPRQTNWSYSDSRGGFIVEANENIAKGEQVMDSYGQKCNSRFLLNYGFIVDNNDANEFPFIVKLTHEYPHYTLKSTNIRERVHVIRLKAEIIDQNFIDLLAVVRFFVEDDLDVVQEFIEKFTRYDCDVPVKSFPPGSLNTEKNVLKWVSEYVRKSNENYPNKLEEDLVKLETAEKENERNCLKIIICEKEVLRYFEKIIPELDDILDRDVDLSDLGIPTEHRYYIKNVAARLNR